MLKVILIGYGYWGSKLARNFQNLEIFKLVSIVDTNRKNIHLAKKNYPLAKTYSNFKTAIKKNFADLIVISTPTATHYKIAKFALENFNNVLVEKPLCLSLKNVKKLNQIAKKNKKMIFVDYPFLFSGTVSFIKKIINKKTYGKILEIESFREQAPVRNDVNVIWDLGAHDISILSYLLKTQPYSINTIKKNNINSFICDSAYINIKYKNNLNVLIKNSWISPTKIRKIKIKFRKAILYCDENESLYKIKIYKKNSKKSSTKYSLEVPEIDLSEPLSKLASYIAKSIKKNNNQLFMNNFNERITYLLEKIDKSDD